MAAMTSRTAGEGLSARHTSSRSIVGASPSIRSVTPVAGGYSPSDAGTIIGLLVVNFQFGEEHPVLPFTVVRLVGLAIPRTWGSS